MDSGGLLLALWRVEEAHLTDLGKFIEYIGNGTIDSFAVQLPTEQTAKHQGENTAEHMYLHLLIGPMVLGTQGYMVAVLHTAKGGLYVVLAAVAADDLYVSPLSVVRKEDRLSNR